MKSTLKARLRVALPIIAGVALVSLQAAAQQQRFYGATGYGTSVVGAYNPYTQAGPGQTAGRAYGAPPVAPYPPAYGAYRPQSPGYPAPAPGRLPTAYPQQPAGQVAAYNPWRMQHGGGPAPGGGGPAMGGPVPGAYVPSRGSVAAYNPGAYARSVAAYDPGANLPQPPAGPIHSRLLSIPEVGNPRGAAAPFQTVPYVPRRTAAARPQMAPRRTVASAPAPRPTQLASGGTGGPALPTSKPPAPPPSAAKPPEPRQPVPVVTAAAPKPSTPPAAPAIAAKPPEPPKSVPPPPPAAAAKPPEPAKPAPPKPAPPKPAPTVTAVVPPPPKPAAPPPAPPPTAPTPVMPPAAAPMRVTFESNSPALSADARASLDKLAADLIAHPDRRTTLKAYSGGTVGSETRRLSLARGLAVRAYLIDKGVPRERLQVEALGTSADGGPADRVDAVAGAGT